MSPARQVLGGFPSRMSATLKYVEFFTLDPGSANDRYVFSLNGLYDPNITGGGHQPSNFDLLMQVYNRYVVHTTKCTMAVDNTGPNQDASETGLYGFLISQTGTDIGSGTPVQQIAEQPFARYSTQTPGLKNAPYVQLTATIPVWEWFGAEKKTDILVEQDYGGTAAANPSRNIYMETFYASPNGNTVTDPSYFRVELEFSAWFYLPRQTTYS